MAELFSPQRLTLARERRGLFIQELAARVGVTPVTVSRWENNKTSPPPEHIQGLSKVLGFPQDFFFGDAPPRLETAAFRSLARMTARQRNMALAAGSQAVALDVLIEEKFERPSPRVPDLGDLASDPENAAAALRAEWGLGYQPIGSLIHRLEFNGIRIFSLVYEGSEIDAFSDWQNDTPYIFLNTAKTTERIRMDASHELGHLVLHAHVGGPTTKLEEDQAQHFAAAFLMPAQAFVASAPRRITLEAILDAKQKWGISALAYVYRLHKLGRIAEYSYRSLCIQLKSHYGKSEPAPARVAESSQVLAKVLGSPHGSKTRKDFAQRLRIHLRDLDEITFGLTLTPLSGSSAPHRASDVGPSPAALKLLP